MHILHIEPQRYNAEVRSRLESVGSVDFVDLHTHADLVTQISSKPYEALFVKLGIPIDKAILDAAPNLQYIVTPTTGLNHIDQEAAANRGITVHSLKGEYEFLANIKSTSEHTWMLLMALVRRLPQAFIDVKENNWRREPFLGMELNGKTLGVIGYGRLGRIVAQYGQAFTMRVLVNDTDPQQLKNLPEGLEAVDLETLSRQSDIVTLHIPSNEENYHFINTKRLQAFKPGVVLVNTSRGEVLEETALLQGL
ncbi:MAG: NAD(P)-dependent oxidoreductase, partial [Bacteroidota bacterium]